MTDIESALQNLRPLHAPAAPEPATILALALVGCAAAALARAAWTYGRAARRPLRGAALKALARSRTLAPPERLAAQAAILRRTIKAAGGAAESRRQGEAWLACLDAHFSTRFFGRGAGRAFGDALYRKGFEPDVELLHGALEQMLARIKQ